MPGINLTTLRSELRIHLGYSNDAVDLSNASADLLLNRSYWELQEKLELPENKLTATYATAVGTETIAISYPVDAILTLSVVDTANNSLVQLHPISEETYNEVYSSDVENRDMPESYLIRGDSIYLTPIPDAIYTINAVRRELLTDLSDSNLNLTLDNSLHEILLMGAVYRGHLRKRDYNASFRLKPHLDSMLRSLVLKETKEQENWKLAQVQVVTNPYTP